MATYLLDRLSPKKMVCGTCHGSGILSDFSGFEYTCRECLGHGGTKRAT